MATGLSTATSNSLLDALLRATAYTGPATIYIQLHTADPGAAGTTAVAGNGTRKAVTFTASAAGATSNSAVITWLAVDVDTAEDYTHWSLWSAASAGTFLMSGTMTANAVSVGDEFTIPAGDLDINYTSIAA